MKKIIVSLVVCSISLGAFAWHGGHRGGHCFRPTYHHHHPHYPHYHSSWGHGGCNFWPGVIGGVIGGVVGNYITTPYYRSNVVVTPTTIPTIVQNTTPVIVQQPTVIQTPSPIVVQNPQPTAQKVWIEGRYIDKIDQNGNTVRVWDAGHWEYR